MSLLRQISKYILFIALVLSVSCSAKKGSTLSDTNSEPENPPTQPETTPTQPKKPLPWDVCRDHINTYPLSALAVAKRTRTSTSTQREYKTQNNYENGNHNYHLFYNKHKSDRSDAINALRYFSESLELSGEYEKISTVIILKMIQLYCSLNCSQKAQDYTNLLSYYPTPSVSDRRMALHDCQEN